MAALPDSDQSSRRESQVEEEQPNLNFPQPAAANTVGFRSEGFDCEFVDKPTEAFQVNCPVCLLVLREPHQVTCCGYNFCKPCIEQVQSGKKSCPLCNTAEFSLFPNKGFQRAIYKLHVHCSHKNEGCQWTGELGELDNHLNENPMLGQQFVGCDFANVACNDCGKPFQRQSFKDHQLEQHPFSCEHCHDYESYYEDVVKNHWPVCGFRQVPCPNECGVYPERQNLERHESSECPVTVVNCDFHYAGCEVQLPRKDMPAHLAKNLITHMTQLATYSQQKVEEKDRQILQLTQQLMQKIDQQKNENEKLSKTLIERIEEIAQLKEDLHAKDQAMAEKIAGVWEEKEEALKREIIQRQEEMVSKEDYEATKRELTQLQAKQGEDRSSLQELQSYIGPPTDLIMTEFEKHKQDDDDWYSEPFYTHPYGYKMCLSVHANGELNAKGTHVSVFAYLMRGKLDDSLRWPFQGNFIIQLINRLEDQQHYTATLDFSDADNDYSNRVTTGGERSPNGSGIIKFLPHSELDNPANNCQFLQDDCLHFRVTRVTNPIWSSLEKQCLAMESRICVPPFEFTMRDFELQKAGNDIWFSPSFYTNERGYRMCLEVYPNGWDAGKGTHVSVYIHLKRGEWDNYLQWPFRGDVTIRLLNQTEDEGHHELTRDFTDTVSDDITGRMTTRRRAQGLGWPQFISHEALSCDPNKQYLHYDSLQFRIAEVTLKRVISGTHSPT